MLYLNATKTNNKITKGISHMENFKNQDSEKGGKVCAADTFSRQKNALLHNVYICCL